MPDDAPAALDRLMNALLEGEAAHARAETQRLLAAGMAREHIVVAGLEAAMNRLDEKCTVEGFNLLEIMLVGRAVSAVVGELYPAGVTPEAGRATFVIATPEGDVHDLGKNIVKTVLIGRGFRVVDLGRDCPVRNLVEAVAREGAVAALVSGLISSVVPQVRRVRSALAAAGLGHVKVVAGGAALKQASPESLNVDYVAETAFDGARYLEQLVQEAVS
jgi:5-methyltetrahydrofolate--homocysteine methyltransferase